LKRVRFNSFIELEEMGRKTFLPKSSCASGREMHGGQPCCGRVAAQIEIDLMAAKA
jgi:hypothetical protein